MAATGRVFGITFLKKYSMGHGDCRDSSYLICLSPVNEVRAFSALHKFCTKCEVVKVFKF